VNDDAQDVLFRPWRRAPPALGPGARVLLVGVGPHRDLDLAGDAACVAVQPWAEPARALEAVGVTVVADVPSEGGFDVALVRLDRQREAGLAGLGRALLALREGGELIAAGPVAEGALRYVEDLRGLGVPLEIDVKARCRGVRLVATAALDRDRARAWAALDAERPVLGGAFRSRPGLFSWEHVDPGSAVLAEVLPADLAGRVADAGSGWGWLAAEILARCPGVARLELLEADRRALDLAVRNLAGRPVTPHWVDATAAWPVQGLDGVVTNPPFHVGGRADPTVGQRFVARAFEALRPGGRLVLVANVHLPYERTLHETFGAWRTLAEARGFKVVEARKPEPVRAAAPRRERRG
jgi:16S rRNA (guanine1207-N2)-methyltransferase